MEQHRRCNRSIPFIHQRQQAADYGRIDRLNKISMEQTERQSGKHHRIRHFQHLAQLSIDHAAENDLFAQRRKNAVGNDSQPHRRIELHLRNPLKGRREPIQFCQCQNTVHADCNCRRQNHHRNDGQFIDFFCRMEPDLFVPDSVTDYKCTERRECASHIQPEIVGRTLQLLQPDRIHYRYRRQNCAAD